MTARGVSPRVVSATLVGSAGTSTVSSVALASALGLPSTWDCFTVSSSLATVASGWDRACTRPTTLGRRPSHATGSTGTSDGGAVAPRSYTGPTGPTGSTGTSAATGPTGTSAGGAVGPTA